MVEEIETAMKGMLAPEYHEVITGQAEIRQVIKASKIGNIAGCYVTDGSIKRNCGIRLIRDGIVVYEGKLASLRRFKDDVKAVSYTHLEMFLYHNPKLGLDIVLILYVTEKIHVHLHHLNI